MLLKASCSVNEPIISLKYNSIQSLNSISPFVVVFFSVKSLSEGRSRDATAVLLGSEYEPIIC